MREEKKTSKKKFAASVWTLRHLKKIGIANSKLTTVYISMVRSQIEDASVVYGPMINEAQSTAIERLQSIALKIIWGWNKSYQTCLEESGLERLDDRRWKALQQFAYKTSQNERYQHWFPLNEETHHDLRKREKYKINFARHERLRRAPIYAMRRLLNQDETEIREGGRDPDEVLDADVG